MPGRVGGHTIREDLYKGLLDKLPEELPVSQAEDEDPLRRRELVSSTERLRTTPVKTLPEFYRLFQDVIRAAEEEDRTEYSLGFTESFPPLSAEGDLALPSLSIRLVNRNPWADSRGKRELVPRYMETIDDPDHPGNKTEIYLHRQMNLVQATVWARTNKVADSVADWVEEKFFEYLWAFQWGGLGQPVIFEGRREDVTEEVKGQLIHGRPLRFFVITGRITKRSMAAMRRVELKLGIRKPETYISGIER